MHIHATEIKAPDSCQYSTFRVDDLLLGIEVVKVQEVFRYQEMTPVPLAPRAVQGLINLRGQIVIALDLRRALSLSPAPTSALPMNIVIQADDGVVSLLVDEIGDVINVPLRDYAAVPENMPQEQKDLIDGVYHLKHGLMLVLNTARILQDACQA
jgi:purine-binding chemotaxis protein CheW